MTPETTTAGRATPSANGRSPCAPSERGRIGCRLSWPSMRGDWFVTQSRIAGDVERGRDVTQETFLRLCREPDVARAEHLGQWLFVVCRRLALDVARKESRMSSLVDESKADSGQACLVAASIDSSDAHAGILRELAALPANQQEVVRLKFQESMSYREIVAITGLSLGNVGYLLHMAIKSLREKLAKAEET